MKLLIKNMVCSRCVMAVKDVFDKQKVRLVDVDLGSVKLLQNSIPPTKYESISRELEALGFELIEDKRLQISEKVKNLIITLVHYSDLTIKTNLSVYLMEKVNYDYTYLSNLFSEVQGITIEKYFISQKIERAKELLTYGSLSLSEIAFKLGYSSVAHLSGQFKKITGVTPSEYKTSSSFQRAGIEKV